METKVNIAPAVGCSSVSLDSSFIELRARGFVRGVTALDQWYLLVNEGWRKTGLPRNDVVIDYLVMMLHRFSGRSELFEQLKAFNYAEYLFGKKKVSAPCVQDIADMCLQFTAFFPESSRSRHEIRSYNYIVDIGTSLYQRMAKDSRDKDDWYSKSFKVMSDSFGLAVVMLRGTCPRFVEKKAKASYGTKGGVVIPSDAEAKIIMQTNKETELMFFEPPAHLFVKQKQ